MEEWQQFEYSSIHYLQNIYPDEHVYHWSDVPEDLLFEAGYINDFNEYRLKKSTNIGNKIPDCGFDGIMFHPETKKFNVLQMKYYTSRNVSGNDIGTFMVKWQVVRFKHPETKAILCTTEHKTSKAKSKRGITIDLHESILAMRGQFIHVKVPNETVNLTQDTSSEENEVTSQRRDYQLEILEEAMKHNKVFLNLACGLGKTLIIGDLLAKIQKQLVFILAPIKTEVDNLYHRIPKFVPDAKCVLFDSDSSTDLKSLEKTIHTCFKNKQKCIVFTTFVSAMNKICKWIDPKITSQDEIEDFPLEDSESDTEITELRDDINKKNTTKENQEKQLLTIKDYIKYALLVVDEAHNISPSSTNLHMFCNFFDHSVFASACLPSYLHKYINYGNVISRDFNFALTNKYIVDYKIYLPLTTQEQPDYTVIELTNTEIARKAMYLYKGMLTKGSRRCIVYCTTKEECREFIKAWTFIGKSYHYVKTWCSMIIDETKHLERVKIINDFESGDQDVFKILVSCGCLDEAVNIVRCDSTFITRVGPKTNEMRVYQRFMRASRLDSKNKHKVNNCFIWGETDEILESSLKRLKFSLHDAQFAKKLNKMSEKYDVNTSTITEEKQNEEIRLKQLEEKVLGWINTEEKAHVLLRFVEKNTRVPKKEETYKHQNIEFKIGGFWCCIKQGQNKQLWSDLLSKNVILLEDYTRMQKLKQQKETIRELTSQQKAQGLLEFVEKNTRVPQGRESYKYLDIEFKIGSFWDGVKQGKCKQLWTDTLSKNDILLDDYTQLQNLKQQKETIGELTSQQKAQGLLEFVEKNTRVPKTEETYKYQNIKFKIGSFWNKMKQGQTKQLWTDTLSKNNLLLEDYTQLQKLKHQKETIEDLTSQQKAQGLIDFVESKKILPIQSEIYKYQNIDFKIGKFWDGIKQGKCKQLWTDILSKNTVLLEDYRRVQKLKQQKETIEELTSEQKAQGLLEFVEKNTRVPKTEETYKHQNINFKIGGFWSNVKQGSNKQLWTDTLSKNDVLLEDYTRVQKLKQQKKEIIKNNINFY
jgi:superfamily II DNA or RNA helicase